MLTTLRKCLQLLPPSSRSHYLLLLPLSVLTGLAETGAALGIFALITVLTDPAEGFAIWWIAALTRYLPWQSQPAMILQLTGLLALFYVGRSALILSVQYFRIRVGHAATAALSGDMLRRYLSAPYPFHFGRNSSDLIRNCTTTVDQSLGLVSAAGGLATDALMAIGMIAVLVATSPAVSLVASIALTVVILVILRLTRVAAARLGRDRHDLSASMLRSLQQALGGVKELKVLGRERYFTDEYAERQREALQIGYLSATLDSAPAVALQTVLVCGALGLVTALTVSGRTGVDTLPVAAVFGYVGLRVLPMVNGIVSTLNHFRSTAPAVEELHHDFIALMSADHPVDGPHLSFENSIVLADVSYTYPTGATPAIAGISLTIRRGESIGVIGATGAGKSTLVDVILGLLPPTRGRLTVDGVDVARSPTPWKRRVGYVPQTNYLIDDTLRRNIALGIPEAEIDDARIHDVLRAAQLDAFVGGLPEGLEARVGERGIRLSGGERQRLAIARALYHDPDVIIFDEATASLDVQTERAVTQTIGLLRTVKTVIVISHRLSSVKGCDRLVWLAHGRIVDMGDFEDLRRRNADFQRLVELASV